MGLFSRILGKKELHEPKHILEQSGEQIGTEQAVESVQEPECNVYTVYFTNGHLSKIDPYPKGGYYENRDIANNANSIISDGVEYDLTSVKSIHSIKIPSYTYSCDSGIGTTGFLEYVLRMRSGGYWNERKFSLAIACLEKATQLMKYSTMGWPPKDYFRIVNELNDLGKFKSAKRWKDWIEANVPGATSALIPVTVAAEIREPLSKEELKSLLKECKYMETDLVEVGDSGVCCEVCAKYRNRIYTLTGKDLRFPRLPKDFHKSCGLSVYPYIWGVSEPTFKCDIPISYSNRPFIDDRTEEDVERRSNWLADLNRQPEVVRKPNLDRIIYYRLVQLLPADSPKSFSGFSRMKKANSKNYQALVKKAEAAGFVFPETLEDVENWPENQ